VNKVELRSLLVDGGIGTPTGRIVRVLSERGALSATQLASITGLAKSTVSTTLSELRKSGLVVEGTHEGNREGSVGRPRTVLTLNPQAGTAVGCVIGLGVIQVIVADVSHAIIADKSVAMEDDYSPEHAVEVIRKLMKEAYAENSISMSGMLGVGVAVSGPVNPIDSRVQRASVVPTWAGVDVREVFGPVLQRPVIADNESNCAALAEMMWGAAVGEDDFVLFKLDGGIGGAIVHGGQVIKGIAGGTGEFGHIVIDPDGELCRCGNRGCLELTASFKSVLERAGHRHGNLLTMDEVIARARAGDVGSRRLIDDTATAAGRGLAMIGTIINPPLIVVGGRLALAGQMLLEPLAASYEKHTLVKRTDVPPELRTRIVVGKFTDNDACLGAVGLMLRHQGHPWN
jgi:predicted NBD/HSP70 family sugar kinase